jgi:NAD(P)H-hydrate repair Nnr-like enzyme with NAD(P)H-hydrate dehydratase domain
LQRENYNHPSSEGTFLIPTLNQRQFIGGSRLSALAAALMGATLLSAVGR